jgi:hypothetical protein
MLCLQCVIVYVLLSTWLNLLLTGGCQPHSARLPVKTVNHVLLLVTLAALRPSALSCQYFIGLNMAIACTASDLQVAVHFKSTRQSSTTTAKSVGRSSLCASASQATAIQCHLLRGRLAVHPSATNPWLSPASAQRETTSAR